MMTNIVRKLQMPNCDGQPKTLGGPANVTF